MDIAMNETTVAVVPQDVVVMEAEAEEKQLTTQVTEIEQRANDFIIETDDDYKNAAEFGRILKQKSAEVKEFFKPMKEQAHKAHKAICDRESAMLKPLTNAEKILKASMSQYYTEQERKRREAEEAARRAAAEEAERKLREAAEAEAAGRHEEAEAAMNEAVIMDEAKNTMTVTRQAPTAAGTSTRKDWQIKSIDPFKVPVAVNGMEIRPVDTAAVMRLIRASKGTIVIPGIVYEETTQMSFRR